MSWKDLISGINIDDYLKGLEFPCSKQDLIDYATEYHAPDRVIELLDKLPDQQYDSLTQVLESEVKSFI